MQEIWKSIKNYEGIYEVSNLGKVRSLDRKIMNSKNYIQKRRGIFLSNQISRKGYLTVNLSKNGENKRIPIHRLVAQAFIINPLNLLQVNHKDENKKNNCVNNLEWCTNEYNSRYGTKGKRTSEKNRNNKSTSKAIYQYNFSGELLKMWPSAGECERKGFNHTGISQCCNGKINSYKGYIWTHKKLSDNEFKAIKDKARTRIDKIYQYDKNLKLIKIWLTTNEIRESEYTASNVIKCCNGERKTHSGYIWSYELIK